MGKTKQKLLYVLVTSLFLLSPFYNTLAITVEDLNSEISNQKKEIDKIESQVSTLEENIQKKQEEEKNLKNQIYILDAEIEKAEAEIYQTELLIESTKIEIEKKAEEIKAKEEEIARQKIILAEFVRVMNTFDQKSPIELLLGYDSFSDYLDDMQYIETLQNKGQETLVEVKKLREELAWEKRSLEAKQEALEELAIRLEQTKELLDQEIESRARLLAETEEQEEKYQALLQDARDEQENINQEIENLENEIRRQIEAQKKENTNVDWQNLKGDGTLAWPVNPERGISAYFMDPSYYRLFGINHYAIDLPTAQGTPMHSPADGYVLRYRDAGYGYSYIAIMHADGLSTVYGHASASFVSEGDFVAEGQVIGLSGGMPGSWGAGWLTTGPHLHFEVRLNGIPVNPINYLPGL